MPVPSTKPRKFVCPTCSKKFTTSGHLSRHARIHTGERNYACPYPGCPTRCSRKDNLSQHYRVHLGPGSRTSRTARQRSRKLPEDVLSQEDESTPEAISVDLSEGEDIHDEPVLRPPSTSNNEVIPYSSPESSPHPADPIVPTLDPPSQTPRAKHTRLAVSTAHLPIYHSQAIHSPQSPLDYHSTAYASEHYTSGAPTSPSSSSAYSDSLLTPEIQTAPLDNYFIQEQQKAAAWSSGAVYDARRHPSEYPLRDYQVTYHPADQYRSPYELSSSSRHPHPQLHQPQPILWSHEQTRYSSYYDSYC